MDTPEPAAASLIPYEDVPAEAPKEVRVIRIMPDSRYAVLLPETYPPDMVGGILHHLQEWLEGNAQFTVIQGLKLVRLNGPAPEEGTGDDAA